jgi:SAM-dependent methyltransferase
MVNWETMWAANGGLQPGQAFDCRQCEPAFQRLLDEATDLPKSEGRTALVPGCGSGYAVLALHQAGYEATGLDIAPTAAAAANSFLSQRAAEQSNSAFDASKCRVVAADFFAHTGQYDLVYDCTFLCALDPDQRVAWAKKCKELLRPDGELVTLIFPVVEPPYEGGPPHCMSPGLVTRLLEPEGFVAKAPIAEVPPADYARPGVKNGAKEFLGRWRVSA